MSQKTIIFNYGIALGICLALFKFIEYQYFSYAFSLEIYLGIAASFFLLLGVYAGLRFQKPAKEVTRIVEKEIPASPTLQPYTQWELSKREYEVLQHLAQGYSNQEIADKLFVSLSTIKTHLSNIYLKLDVKRRTQAVSKAKELRIII